MLGAIIGPDELMELHFILAKLLTPSQGRYPQYKNG
jgi:hypothetical protein